MREGANPRSPSKAAHIVVIAQDEAKNTYALGNPAEGRYQRKRSTQDEQHAEELRRRISETNDFDKVLRWVEEK
jgi:exonuclease VII large subunit